VPAVQDVSDVAQLLAQALGPLVTGAVNDARRRLLIIPVCPCLTVNLLVLLGACLAPLGCDLHEKSDTRDTHLIVEPPLTQGVSIKSA